MDFRQARDRRRFFLEQGFRKRRPSGRREDLDSLMALSRTRVSVNIDALLAGIPFCVVGGVATRAYMPERFTKDLDILVDAADFAEAETRLRNGGYVTRSVSDDLFFAHSHLGLFGRVWQRDESRVDLIASDQSWVDDALELPAYDQTGLRVIPLPFLVLMKLDASRGQDQADVERMLGRLDDAAIERVAAIVDRYSGDPQAAEDVRQYATLGRLEYEAERDLTS